MMKKLAYLIILLLTLASCGRKISGSTKTEVFHVSGNCGMCKKTIEKSLKVKGVIDADWNKKTKMLSVSYDTSIITLDQIKRNVSLAGYDNDAYRADDATYNKLHSCCQYDREE